MPIKNKVNLTTESATESMLRHINNTFDERNLRATAEKVRGDWYFEDTGLNRYRAFSGIVLNGNSVNHKTFMGRHYSPFKLIDEWKNHLESIEDKMPSLWEFEMDMEDKVGPLSVMQPLPQRLDKVLEVYTDAFPQSAPAPILDAALWDVAEEFGVRSLCVRSERNTWMNMKKSTNSGAPYFLHKRDLAFASASGRLVYASNDIVRAMLDGDLSYFYDGSRLFKSAAILGWRGQEAGPSVEDVKQRTLGMMPTALNLRELQVYQPLIEGAQRKNVVPAWVSMDAVDRHFTRLFTTLGDDVLICTDFTMFDSHVNYELQRNCESILSMVLTNNYWSRQWLKDVFYQKYTIPLILCVDGDDVLVINGLHGMMSGSGGTNADETLIHRALQHECARLNQVGLNPFSMCLGDDGVLSFRGISVEKVTDAYESHGLEMNLDKQYVSDSSAVYLKRWHHKDYRPNGECAGVYSTIRALGRLCFLERRMRRELWTKEMQVLRSLSILENCKWHPMIDEFIDFVVSKDKYRLGLDLPGFFDNVDKLAKEATTLKPDFLGYTKMMQADDEFAGIDNWYCVKYLKSKLI